MGQVSGTVGSSLLVLPARHLRERPADDRLRDLPGSALSPSSTGITLYTESIGTASPADCKCPEGLYQPASGGDCLNCTEGMFCAFGSSLLPDSTVVPLTLPSFMVLHDEPVGAY